MMILIIVVTSNLYQGRGYKLAQWPEASVANEKARALECAYF
jgi:hypothetical protein